MPDDGDGGELVRQKRSGTVSTAAVETREERRRRVGRENFNGVLLSGTTTAALMSQSQSHVKYIPKNNSPDHHIGHMITVVATVYFYGVLYTVC